MHSAGPSRSPAPALTSAKIVVAGGLGVGKTTFVGAVSEIMPLTTEAVMTDAAAGLDDLALTPLKSTTTVAMDFGRVALDHDVILYLFGTPGQRRFWFMWDDLLQGALGAVVLADTPRLSDSFAPIDYFEQRQLPFVIGVNGWDGHHPHPDTEVRDALALAPHIPLIRLDARSKDSVKDAPSSASPRTPSTSVASSPHNLQPHTRQLGSLPAKPARP